ncbi:ABC-type multidrug transport system permease subunit [Elusimicrobium posterum]|uniref:hypothetical protein n=1 Tax=Elusimicrobium posterum TaxID=3116653 RepID=UPI003C7400AE
MEMIVFLFLLPFILLFTLILEYWIIALPVSVLLVVSGIMFFEKKKILSSLAVILGTAVILTLSFFFFAGVGFEELRCNILFKITTPQSCMQQF